MPFKVKNIYPYEIEDFTLSFYLGYSSKRKFLIDLGEVYLVFTFGTGIRYTFTSVF